MQAKRSVQFMAQFEVHFALEFLQAILPAHSTSQLPLRSIFIQESSSLHIARHVDPFGHVASIFLQDEPPMQFMTQFEVHTWLEFLQESAAEHSISLS